MKLGNEEPSVHVAGIAVGVSLGAAILLVIPATILITAAVIKQRKKFISCLS